MRGQSKLAVLLYPGASRPASHAQTLVGSPSYGPSSLTRHALHAVAVLLLAACETATPAGPTVAVPPTGTPDIAFEWTWGTTGRADPTYGETGPNLPDGSWNREYFEFSRTGASAFPGCGGPRTDTGTGRRPTTSARTTATGWSTATSACLASSPRSAEKNGATVSSQTRNYGTAPGGSKTHAKGNKWTGDPG